MFLNIKKNNKVGMKGLFVMLLLCFTSVLLAINFMNEQKKENFLTAKKKKIIFFFLLKNFSFNFVGHSSILSKDTERISQVKDSLSILCLELESNENF